MGRFWNWARGAGIFLGSILALAAQVSADNAISNVGSYLKALGLDAIPNWLSVKSIDTWAFYIGLGTALALLMPLLVQYLIRRFQRTFFEREYLELYELAYLSVGKRPRPGKPMPNDVLHRHRLMKDAIGDGKLVAKNLNSDGDPNVLTKVHLEDFWRYAQHENHDDFIRIARKWMALHRDKVQVVLLERDDLYLPMHKAVAHISDCIGDYDAKNCFPQARLVIRQNALDGKLRIRGCKELNKNSGATEFSAVHTMVPAEYWAKSTVGALATAGDEHAIRDTHTNPETVYAWGEKGVYEKNRYSNLLVNWIDVLKLWPTK